MTSEVWHLSGQKAQKSCSLETKIPETVKCITIHAPGTSTRMDVGRW